MQILVAAQLETGWFVVSIAGIVSLMAAAWKVQAPRAMFWLMAVVFGGVLLITTSIFISQRRRRS